MSSWEKPRFSTKSPDIQRENLENPGFFFSVLKDSGEAP